MTTTGYRGRVSRRASSSVSTNLFLLLVLLLLLGSADFRQAVKRRHHWKANVIKNHLKNHKSLEGMVRLVDGNSEYEGNVEILHLGKWGAICDDEWDIRDGQVICRQLGLNGTSRVTHSSHFGQASRNYWMDNIRCGGQEREISECRFDSWGENDCDPSEAAGVVCDSPEVKKPDIMPSTDRPAVAKKIQKYKIKDTSGPNIELRLVGGRTPNEGRVEAKTNDGWGVICGDGFGVLEAMVVCRSVRSGYVAGAFQTDQFGGLDLPIVLSSVECAGNESTLAHCYHQHKAACSSRKETVAAVVCAQDVADLAVNTDEIVRSAYLEDRQMYFLQCAMEENCLASSAYQLRHDETDWHLITRRLLRFTAKITNVGTAPFRPAIPKHLWQFHQCHIKQNRKCWVHNINKEREVFGEYTSLMPQLRADQKRFFMYFRMTQECFDEILGWILDEICKIPTHFRMPIPPSQRLAIALRHYHSMEVFATFDVLDGGGMKVAEGHKASFCLEDNQCTDGAKPAFACANYGDQGISVNCSDIYRHNIDCQWVDITDLNPGLYTLKVSVNPEYKIPEMTYSNNAAVCSMFYSETFVRIHDCVVQNP